MAQGTDGIRDFVAHWGWLYVVYQLAEFFRESRNEQYEKGAIEFYNDLAFMADHHRWQKEVMEQQAMINKLEYGR